MKRLIIGLLAIPFLPILAVLAVSYAIGAVFLDVMDSKMRLK